MNFTDQIDNGVLAVYICNHGENGVRCKAQILRANNVKLLTLNSIGAEDEDCINVYDEPTKTVASSAIPIDGNNINCLKCNGMVGIRKGTHIIFDSTKLQEMMIYSLNRFITNVVHQGMFN